MSRLRSSTNFIITRARRCGLVAPHFGCARAAPCHRGVELGGARRAATRACTSPVAGLKTSAKRPERPGHALAVDEMSELFHRRVPPERSFVRHAIAKGPPVQRKIRRSRPADLPAPAGINERRAGTVLLDGQDLTVEDRGVTHRPREPDRPRRPWRAGSGPGPGRPARPLHGRRSATPSGDHLDRLVRGSVPVQPSVAIDEAIGRLSNEHVGGVEQVLVEGHRDGVLLPIEPHLQAEPDRDLAPFEPVRGQFPEDPLAERLEVPHDRHRLGRFEPPDPGQRSVLAIVRRQQPPRGEQRGCPGHDDGGDLELLGGGGREQSTAAPVGQQHEPPAVDLVPRSSCGSRGSCSSRRSSGHLPRRRRPPGPAGRPPAGPPRAPRRRAAASERRGRSRNRAARGAAGSR